MVDVAFTDYAFTSTGGSADRTYPDRLVDIRNVKDYGAKGDGVTDDWDAINAAITWNNETVEVSEHVYSGAFRIASQVWSSGTVTVTTTEPHGWTGTVLIKIINTFSSGGTAPGYFDGDFTATIVDETTFTYSQANNPLPAGYFGSVFPRITSATWAADVVTVTYDDAHRLISGLQCNVSGFSSGNGLRTITVLNSTQLTFPLTGSGTITLSSYVGLNSEGALIRPRTVLPVVSVPSAIVASDYYMADEFPTCFGQSHNGQVTAKTSNTITLGAGNSYFQADIESGATVRFYKAARGTIFFPAGTYKISKHIPFSDHLLSITLLGVGANSVIYGNFADFLVSRNVKNSSLGPILIEKLKFVNDHASGGGARLVQKVVAVRDCVFECNIGIHYTTADYRNSNAFGVSVASSIFTPGLNPTGSIGIQLSVNHGSVFGCYFNGLGNGIASGNFGQTIQGNYFVDCDVGIKGGTWPFDTKGTIGDSALRGNYFKNNEVGLWAFGGLYPVVVGNYIEGGANATHGLLGRVGAGGASPSHNYFVKGLGVSGSFSAVGIDLPPNDSYKIGLYFRSVQSVSWSSRPTTAHSITIANCDMAPVYTYAQTSGRGLTAASWSSGTVTLTTSAAHGMSGTQEVIVSGVTVGGSVGNRYNGVFTTTSLSGSSIQYALSGDPGTSDTPGAGSSIGSALLIKAAGSNDRHIKTIDWAANVVTVQTWVDHYLTPSSSITVGRVTVGGSAANAYNGAFAASTITITGADTFTYALVASDPGVVDSSCLASGPNDPDTTTAYLTITNGSLNYSEHINEGITFYNISDGAKLGGGTAAIGDFVQGGGSQHIKIGWTRNGWVRYG